MEVSGWQLEAYNCAGPWERLMQCRTKQPKKLSKIESSLCMWSSRSERYELNGINSFDSIAIKVERIFQKPKKQIFKPTVSDESCRN